MGFIGKLIPSVIAGGLGFWILTMLFENLYLQIIGSVVIKGKKKMKSKVKNKNTQTNETKEETK